MANDLFQTDINLNQEAFDEWMQYRKEIKKPYKSQASVQKLIKKLAKYDYETQQKMVDQSMENGWQGLFEVKEEMKKKSSLPSFAELHRNLNW